MEPQNTNCKAEFNLSSELDLLTNELWEYAVDTLHELSVTKLNWEH